MGDMPNGSDASYVMADMCDLSDVNSTGPMNEATIPSFDRVFVRECDDADCSFCLLELKHNCSMEELRARFASLHRACMQSQWERLQAWQHKVLAYQTAAILLGGSPEVLPPPPPQIPMTLREATTVEKGAGKGIGGQATAAAMDEAPQGQTYKGFPSYEHWASRRGYVWLIQTGKAKKKWTAWDDDWQEWLEHKSSSGTQTHYQDMGYSYTVDFVLNIQKNNDTSTVRSIRREIAEIFIVQKAD
jgi:hypothetical protein